MCPNVDPAAFPGLNAGNHRDTSPQDTRYNCIAFAASVQNRWWWPDPFGQGYWPPNVPRVETVDAFVRAYETLGYVRCADGTLESGYEKVAIYVDSFGGPTHAARQLPSGKWTSKLGGEEDIEHDTLEAVEGPLYGRSNAYLKRPI